jgi:hypothetical protein
VAVVVVVVAAAAAAVAVVVVVGEVGRSREGGGRRCARINGLLQRATTDDPDPGRSKTVNGSVGRPLLPLPRRPRRWPMGCQ